MGPREMADGKGELEGSPGSEMGKDKPIAWNQVGRMKGVGGVRQEGRKNEEVLLLKGADSPSSSSSQGTTKDQKTSSKSYKQLLGRATVLY